MTPQQEKSFGTEGALSVEGEKWRISVAPYSHQLLRDVSVGKRNLLANEGSLLIERENLALRSIGGAAGMADFRKHVAFDQHLIILKCTKFRTVITELSVSIND